MTNTSREVGGVLGIAVLGTILTTRLTAAFEPTLTGLGIPSAQAAAIGAAASHGDLSPALLEGLTAAQQSALVQGYADAFMVGFHTALIVGGSVLLLAALVANRFIPGRETIAQHHADAEALAVAH